MVELKEVKKDLLKSVKDNRLHLTLTENSVIFKSNNLTITLTNYGIWYAESIHKSK